MALTTITDTYWRADLAQQDGTLQAVPSAVTWKGGDGKQIFQGACTATITAGAFSIQLEPTDVGIPSGVFYNIVVVINGLKWQEKWIVPTSGSPVVLDTVRISVSPPVGLTPIPLTQLAQSGASVNWVPVWNGSVWVAAPSPGSGIHIHPITSPVTSVSIPAATHGLGTYPIVTVYDDSSPAHVILADVAVATNGDVTVSFSPASTGTAVLTRTH